MVTHPSANRGLSCLCTVTSVFSRELVFLTWYGCSLHQSMLLGRKTTKYKSFLSEKTYICIKKEPFSPPPPTPRHQICSTGGKDDSFPPFFPISPLIVGRFVHNDARNRPTGHTAHISPHNYQ